MKTKSKLILFVFIACAIIYTPQIVRPQNDHNIDVVLVIDSSGSMQKNDPLSLRVPAAKLFISLLDEGDRAGIVSFSDRGHLLSDLTFVDSEENKNKLFSAADRISADGLYTNLFEAFNSGYVTLSLQKESDREKIIVLMSDGMMDVGNLDQDRRLIDTLENSLTETLRKDNIRVYTIAFTDQSDRKLLEKISKRTGGFYNTAPTDKDFHGVFTSIFEGLKSPEMVPMSENGFVIDSSIEELTIVATKSSPDTKIEIISPDGGSYSSSHKYSGIGWFVSDNFDMITILRPLEGKWEILFSTGENNKAYVITNLKLKTDFDHMYAIFGEHLDIRMWFEKDGAIITEDQILDKIKVYIELTGPDGNTTELQAFHKGEGIFLRTIAPFTPGNHKMRLVARGMTFERAKNFAFNVANLEESKKDLQEQREDKKRQMEAEAGKKPDREKDEGEVSFMKLFVQFIVMNIILGIITLGYFRREKVIAFIQHINVKDLMQSARSLTKLIQRKQKGEEQSGSAQSAEDEEATGKGGPAEEQVPQSATETGKQPEAETLPEEAPPEQEAEEIQTIETKPDTETVKEESPEEAPPKQETENIQTIGTVPDAEQPQDENQENPQKNMIDLEEIEMEEKGKQAKALQEDKEEKIDPLPDTEDDNQLDKASQEAEISGEAEAWAAETETDASDDIELTPKDSPDQPDGTSQEAVPEEDTEQQAASATEESPEMQLAPDDTSDQPDETSQETVPEEDSEQQAGPAPEVDVFDSVITEMEEAMNQKQQPGEKADTSAPESTLPEDAEPDAEGDVSSA